MANLTTEASKLAGDREAEIRRAMRLMPFRSFNRKAAAHARQVMISLRTDDLQHVLAIVRHERSSGRRLWRAAVMACLGFPFLCGEALLLWADSPHHHLTVMTLVSIAIIAIDIGMICAWAPGPLQARATQALARFYDISVVGPLAESLRRSDLFSQRTVRAAITRLLPQFKSSDAALLSQRQRAVLNVELQLSARKHPATALAILLAWEQVGDASCIPAVQKLANATRRDKIPREVVARAQECLPLLMESAQVQRTHQELLRAAGTAPDNEATLLRAGSSVAGAEADLLRPGEAQVLLNEAAAVTSQTLKS